MIKSRMTRPATPTVDSLRSVREASRSAEQGARRISPFTFKPERAAQFHGRRRGSADTRLNGQWFAQQLDEARLTSIAATALLTSPDYAAAVWDDGGRWAVDGTGTVAPEDYRKPAQHELAQTPRDLTPVLLYSARLAITAGDTTATSFIVPLETQLSTARAAELERRACLSLGSVAASTITSTSEFEQKAPLSQVSEPEDFPRLFGTITEIPLPPSLATEPFPINTAGLQHSGESFTSSLAPKPTLS